MHYLIYKITNFVNGKIYIGAHKTDNLNDVSFTVLETNYYEGN